MSKELVPYAALLAAVMLIYIPRIFVARGQAQQPEGYDNANPRAQQAKLTGQAARAQAAHNNAIEAFAPFAAGVLACKIGGVDADEIALLSIAFVGLRTIYLVMYLKNLATIRSVVWSLGFLVSLALLTLPLFA
ncbi:MAG TPA: MAPEG family protein [Enhygromyxa sp.]|nr:MAPEG family protein [Enhygromyxa sp.]